MKCGRADQRRREAEPRRGPAPLTESSRRFSRQEGVELETRIITSLTSLSLVVGFRWFLIHLPINYAASLSLMKRYTLTSWKEVIGLQRNQLTIRKRSHTDSQVNQSVTRLRHNHQTPTH